jgi:glycoprotein 2-beta-D-xylosyltransferase
MKRLQRNTSFKANWISMIVLIVLLAASYVYTLANQVSLVPNIAELSNHPHLKTFQQPGNRYSKSNHPRLETFDQSGNDYRKCGYNAPFPRPQHACVVHPMTKIPYCQIENLRVDVDKIHMKAIGGEALDTVMGQDEKAEFPKYTKGAFVTLKGINMTSDRSNFHYLKDVMNNVQVQKEGELTCTRRIPGLTLMITRYEYCNAYHTMTDWFNAFLALPEFQWRNVTVVFLDGHPQGKLDSVWSTLFGNVMYAKQLPAGGVCFDHVTMIPPGYSSVLWPQGRAFTGLNRCPSMMEAFVKFFVQGHGLQNVQKQPGRVTVIDRIPYLAHPRSKPKNSERMVQNFEDIAVAVRNVTGVTKVQVVQFEKMSFHEQLRTIRETHVLIGNHGAGMAHLLFMQDFTFVLEFNQPASRMFVDFANWKPKIKHILLGSITGNRIPQNLIDKEVVPHVAKLLLDGGVE